MIWPRSRRQCRTGPPQGSVTQRRRWRISTANREVMATRPDALTGLANRVSHVGFMRRGVAYPIVSASEMVVRISTRRERDAAQHLAKSRASQRDEFLASGAGRSRIRAADRGWRPACSDRRPVAVAADGRRHCPERDRAVISTRPVRLRSPSVAGAHGSPVAVLEPVGYPETVYCWPRFRPACSV